MEREFGERSFKPAPFSFVTIYNGTFSQEYHRLFTRKLPGQILMSAYYTPMTIRELAVELGVACVYLEDEIAILEEYKLLSKTAADKYQTNLVIFTDAFTKEFHTKAAVLAQAVLPEIVSGMRDKLGNIKELNDISIKLSDERLLWSLLWPVMRQGHKKFEQRYSNFTEKEELYRGATGTNYGDATEEEDEFSCGSFAGYAQINDSYYASAADFTALPKANWYFGNGTYTEIRESIDTIVSEKTNPKYLILTKEEETCLFEILTAEMDKMATLYQKLYDCACDVMRNHAPHAVSSQIERIIFQTLFFRTVGLIGNCSVKYDALPIPDFDGPAAMYIRTNSKEAKSSANQGVMVTSYR